MMYQNKFVVAIKHDGKVLREMGDVVQLPFGSEFTVLVKSLNSKRAKFTMHIDGTDVLDGTEIIVNANSEVELKRFIKNGNLNEGNAFKFIERTKQIEDGPRGIKVEDGLVRIEFWFEQDSPKTIIDHHHHYHHYRYDYWRDRYSYPPNGWPYYSTETVGSTDPTDVGGKSIRDSVTTSTTFSSNSTDNGSELKFKGIPLKASNVVYRARSVDTASAAGVETYPANATLSNDNIAGITVPGSKVEQKFSEVYGFKAETQSHVIVLKLVGKTQNEVEITKPVTVKSKQKCVTCGHVNKSSAKFCSQCGTALEIL